MAAAKILVVDDRRENILFLANDVLRPEGYEVITAMDGEKGFQKARQENPDLIITDIRMPKMTGNELLLALRESGQDTPVILTTFHGSERTAIQAFRAGATDYLIKPFTVEEMMQAVERALSLRPKPAAPPPQVEPQDRPKEPTTQKLLERRLVELSTLHDIGKAVTALLDLEEVFSRIVEAAVYLASAEEGYLMLMDPPSGELYLRAGWSYGQKHAQGFRLKVDDSLTGQVVSSGKPIVLKPPPIGDAGHKLKTGHLTKSMLAVPIKGMNKVIGVLSVDNVVKRIEFTEDDTLQLSILAEYAAIAIENARLYKQAQERAEALARILEEQPAGTLNLKEPAEAEPEETPTRPGLIEADIAGWRTEATGLANRLRVLAEEAEKLAQRLQPGPPSSDETKGSKIES
jgi:two-component system NtrC family sensor kinase